LVPPGDAEGAVGLLDRVDALVVAGGAFDIHPSHYGQAVAARLDRVDEGRTETELALLRDAVARDVPVLGVCGGMQALVVALGGTLVQHVEGHEQATDPATPWHALHPEGPALAWMPTAVNSTHHQAVASPGPLQVVARAPDGVIEAVTLPGARFCAGVQWHPELLDGGVFAALVRAAGPRPPGAPG
jgi:putative glutamine amidotransferase